MSPYPKECGGGERGMSCKKRRRVEEEGEEGGEKEREDTKGEKKIF